MGPGACGGYRASRDLGGGPDIHPNSVNSVFFAARTEFKSAISVFLTVRDESKSAISVFLTVRDEPKSAISVFLASRSDFRLESCD